jgi:hypothetical protein
MRPHVPARSEAWIHASGFIVISSVEIRSGASAYHLAMRRFAGRCEDGDVEIALADFGLSWASEEGINGRVRHFHQVEGSEEQSPCPG